MTISINYILYFIALLCTGSALWSQRNSSYFSSDHSGTLAFLILLHRRKTLKKGSCHSLLLNGRVHWLGTLWQPLVGYLTLKLIWHTALLDQLCEFIYNKNCMLTIFNLEVDSSRVVRAVLIFFFIVDVYQIFLRHENIDEKYCYDDGCLHDLKLNEWVRARKSVRPLQ